jgi:hypothetical protein
MGGIAMEMQEIDVFIDKSGEVRLEVRGVKGSACLEITKQLEIALGGDVASREMTPEAQEVGQSQADQQRLRGG